MKQWTRGGGLYGLAAALLITEFLLCWLLDKPFVLEVLDYMAGAVWTVGIVLLLLPMFVLRGKGKVPKGKSYVETEVLVDTGIYAIVRHPQYLGWLLMYPTLILFNPHWLLAVVGVLGMVCLYLISSQEDRRLVEKFGEPYERYMESVPRMNLLAGVMRLLRHEKRE